MALAGHDFFVIVFSMENELESLREENTILKQEVKKLRNENQNLFEIVKQNRRKFYAPSSEQLTSLQVSLFDEAELLALSEGSIQEETASEETDKKEIEVHGHKRQRSGQNLKNLPDILPREVVVIDIPESERICPVDGKVMPEIGEEYSEKLETIPAKLKVIRTVTKKYGCLACEEKKNAVKPAEILPGTLASPSLLAQIITAKYNYHLPLYRQEGFFAEMGIGISRQTMARWIIDLTPELVPLTNLMRDKILESGYVGMDETPVQVLKEKGKKATSKSYMWVQYGRSPHPMVIYDYRPGRGGSVPIELLQGFKGYLQVDGYVGYDQISAQKEISRLGCMDHCRRKFFDAFKTSSGKGTAKKFLILFKKLYEIEEKLKGHLPETRHKVRLEKSVPFLDEIKKLIDECRGKILPKSQLGLALSYAFNEWPYLTRYLEDGRLEMTNIMLENKIRPFALGRRNWLFSDTTNGADASAILFSLIETAKANNLIVFDYLKNLFEKIPHAKTVEEFEALLPFKN
jgi:transposase